MRLLPRWRIMTWIIWIWTVFFVILIVAGISDRASNECPPGDRLCANASDVGTGIGVVLLVLLWFFGFLVLSLIWFMTRRGPRECPRCGKEVKPGLTVCGLCGYDFGLATAVQRQPDT